MWRDWFPHTLLMGMQIGAVMLVNNLLVPQKFKEFPWDPGILLLVLCPRETKILSPYRNPYMNVHSSITHISLEAGAS